MGKRSVIVWLSSEANKIIKEELEKINENKSRRRSDDILTKSEICSQIIDKYYKIKMNNHA